jgi:integrase/recombinase XerC
MEVMPTLTQRIEEFLRYLEAERGASPHTRAAYRRDLDGFAEHVEALRPGAGPDDVDVPMVRGYLGDLYGTVTASTISRKLSALRSFYRFLGRRGLASTDPVALLRSPRLKPPLPRFLPVDEATRLMELPRDDDARELRDRALLEVLYGAGLRVSELAGLSLDSLDLEAGLVRVTGKGRKERVVPLGRKAVAALREYLPRRGELVPEDGGIVHPEAVFLSSRGRRISVRRVQQVVDEQARRAGVRGRTSPHDLRHSCATHLLDSGADLRSIQELLGHASLSTTQRYTHVTIDTLMAVYENAHPLERRKKDR